MKAVSPDYPWLQQPVIEWLNYILLDVWTVVETGAGGSTVFFARRAARVISFEHDTAWHAKVQAALLDTRQCLDRVVDLRLETQYPTIGLTRLPDRVDLAFIDGRGRVKSIDTVIDSISSGGYLVLDDSDREHYARGRQLAEARAESSILFRSGPDCTTAWKLK